MRKIRAAYSSFFEIADCKISVDKLCVDGKFVLKTGCQDNVEECSLDALVEDTGRQQSLDNAIMNVFLGLRILQSEM